MKRLQRARPWQQVAVAILSFGVSLLMFWFLWGSLPFALIIMISVAFHELCHLLVLRYYGVKSGIVFLLIFATTYYTNIDEETLRWDKLTKSVWVFSAGLIGNCALGLILLGLRGAAHRWFIEPVEWYLLFAALINLYLALFNLTPIKGLGTDGWKIVTTIMYCFSEEREEAAALFLILAELIGIIGTWLLMGLGRMPLFIGWVVMFFFASNFASNLRLSRQLPQPVPEGLTKDEAMRHVLIYFGLVVLTLSGFWLLGQ